MAKAQRTGLYSAIPPGHVERLLPLRETAARPLTTVGVGRAGISSSPRGFEISSPARMTHKVIVTLRGQGEVECEGERVAMDAGTLTVLPAGRRVRYATVRGRWTRLWWNLAETPHWAEIARRGLRCEPTSMAPQLHWLMEGMLAELGHARPVLPSPAGRPRGSYASARDFLEAQLADRYGWALPPAPSVAAGGPKAGELYARLLRLHLHTLLEVDDASGGERQGARLDRLWAKVRESLHAGWTTAAMAAELGMSVATLHRVTRERYARTPGAMLAQLRLEQAQRLLALTDDSVKQIAHKLGYASPFAFSSAFKRQTGQSPQLFRTQTRAPR